MSNSPGWAIPWCCRLINVTQKGAKKWSKMLHCVAITLAKTSAKSHLNSFHMLTAQAHKLGRLYAYLVDASSIDDITSLSCIPWKPILFLKAKEILLKQVPSLKLTFSPLKMDGWNTTFLLGWPIFRCYVSFREGKTWATCQPSTINQRTHGVHQSEM